MKFLRTCSTSRYSVHFFYNCISVFLLIYLFSNFVNLYIYHIIDISILLFPLTIFSAISSLVSLSSQSSSLSIYLPLTVLLPLTLLCPVKPPSIRNCPTTGYINGVSLPPIEIILSALTFYQPKNINSRISRNPIVPHLRLCLCHRTEL